MWSNFHTHSNFCDGKGELTDYVKAAVQNNMYSLGFSSHAPVPFDCKWCMKRENLDAYLAAVDKLRHENSLQIYKSLEIDFIPGIISPLDFRDKLDYTVGSVHFVDQFAEGRPWEIDGLHAVFLEGLQQIFRNNPREAFIRYFELTREMVMESQPDIVGHLDKMKIQNPQEKFFRESESWYKDEIVRTLDVIADTGSIIEVNTRGLYQKKSETSYPSPWILELAHEKNIPVTLSSDAHHPDDLTNRFTAMAEMLLKIGYKKLSVFTEGRWKSLPYTPHGLIA